MVLERIKEYIDYKGITIAAFERSIGMSNASFGKSLKNKGAIGSDKIENILSIYDDLSPDWLLTGKGNMLKGVVEQPPSPQQSNEKEPTQLLNQLLDTIKGQAEEIGQLKEQVRQLTIEKERLASNAHSSHAANVG